MKRCASRDKGRGIIQNGAHFSGKNARGENFILESRVSMRWSIRIRSCGAYRRFLVDATPYRTYRATAYLSRATDTRSTSGRDSFPFFHIFFHLLSFFFFFEVKEMFGKFVWRLIMIFLCNVS